MLIFTFFFFLFCNICLKKKGPTCLNHPLRQSKTALFSIFCFISLSGVRPAHGQPPLRLLLLNISPPPLSCPHPKVFVSPVGSDTRSTASRRHLSTSVQSPISTCPLSPPLTCLPLPSACLSPVTPSRLPDGCVRVRVCLCDFIAGSHLAEILWHYA